MHYDVFEKESISSFLPIIGGSGISTPQQRPYKDIEEDLKNKIDEGTILLGELVEPKTYHRLKIHLGELEKDPVKDNTKENL